MSTLEQLLEIYGRQDIQNVGTDLEYINLARGNEGDLVFAGQDLRVKKIKSRLEKTAGIQVSTQHQVKNALKVLKQMVRSDDQEGEMCERLIRRSYYLKWSEKQKAYYDQTAPLLTTTLDYFLSFTQRNQGGAGNPINSDHYYLIRSQGMLDPRDKPQNELARMLHLLLQNSKYAFRGFFFPAHENDSGQVSQKLKEALERSLVFIQLVQNDMFSNAYPPQPNYCFDEYTMADVGQKKMVLIFANGQHPDDLIAEDAIGADLEDWYKFIVESDLVDIKPTRVAEQSMSVEDNRTSLNDHLVERLRSFQASLWESVPGDLD